MTEQEQRVAVVNEAKSWLRTPYHHQGFIKGVGVDCGFLLIKVFELAGLIPWIDPRPYPHDWHLHRDAERYLGWVKEYATEVKDRETLPGDIVLYQFGRCISHGAIVLDYPNVIHSYIGQGVIISNTHDAPLAGRQRGVFSFWG